MKQDLFQLIKESGNEVLKYAHSNSFILKEDASPVTYADKASHQYLCKNLLDIRNIPILSEENIISFSLRKRWDEFWLIDPLDGTKEFMNGFADFCINIALVQNQEPVLGLIYAPKLNELYWAEKGRGFEYHGEPQKRLNNKGAIVAVSRFHCSSLIREFITINQFKCVKNVGAALKFGHMALGKIDLYPRFEDSREWDIAAGHIILKEAKCFIMDLHTSKEPIYNKQNLKNNYFIANRPNIEIDQLKYPNFS